MDIKRSRVLYAGLLLVGLATVLILIWQPFGDQLDKDPYVVGGVLPLTGDAAQWGQPARRGAELAIASINSDGGVHGRLLELQVEDTRCNPRDGVSGFNHLLAISRPGAVLGGVCSSVTLAIAPIAEREEVVLISPASTNPDISQAGEFIFRVIPSDDFRGKVFADYIYGVKGIQKVAILYINNEGGLGNRNAFRDRFMALGGKIVAEETYTQDATDVRSQLTRLQNSPAEALVVVSYPRDTVLVLRQVQELGFELSLYFQTEAVEDPNVLREAGDTVEGVTYILPAPALGEINELFQELYIERYDSKPELFAAEAYDVIMLIRRYLAESDQEYAIDPNELRSFLYSIENFQGASGTMTFDENGDVEKPMAIREIRNGKPVTIEIVRPN